MSPAEYAGASIVIFAAGVIFGFLLFVFAQCCADCALRGKRHRHAHDYSPVSAAELDGEAGASGSEASHESRDLTEDVREFTRR